MKNIYQKAVLFLFISILYFNNGYSQNSSEPTSVTKFNSVLTKLQTELSSSTTNGLDNEIHSKIYSVAKVFMIIALLIIFFLDIIGLFKGDQQNNKDAMYFGKTLLIFILILFSKTITVNAVTVFNSLKNVIANTITLQDSNNSTDLALNAYRDTVNKAISDSANNDSDITGLKENGNKIVSSIYFWIIEFLLMLYNLACFIVNVFSDFLIQLMLLFFPLVLTINMVPGFTQSLLQYAKYLLSFALWPLIAGIVKLVAQKLAFAQIFGTISAISSIAQTGKLDPSNYVSIPALLVLVLMIFMITMIPMIADMLISGSQSGSFFSSTVGKATAATGTVVAGSAALANASPAKVGAIASAGASKIASIVSNTNPAPTNNNTNPSASSSVNNAINNINP